MTTTPTTAPADLVPLNVSVSHPSKAALARGPDAALAMVEAFVVVDAETYQLGAEELADIKGRLTRLDAQRKSITKPMDDAKSAVMALFREPVAVLERAEAVLKRKLLAYSQEQEALAAEARRQAEEAARAERQRQAAAAAAIEAAAAAERAKMAAAAQALTESSDAVARDALQIEIAERAAEADRLRLDAESRQLAAQMVVAAPAAAEPPKVAGLSTRKTVVFEVVDKLALVRHVAANPDLLHLLVEDSTRLRAYVRGLGLACKLPGVNVREDASLSSRRS